jgi:hypothetical protein
MSSYVTLQDLQARMPQFPLTATSRPSVSEAEVYIADAEAEFESDASNAGYALPITGPIALRYVRTAVILLSISRILYARGAAVGGDAAMQSADKYQKLYDDYRKKLFIDEMDPAEMIDAVRTGRRRDKPRVLVSSLWTVDSSETGDPRVSLDDLF